MGTEEPLAAGHLGVIVVFLAVTHFEVFEHQLLAGWAPAVLQRVGVTVALALAAAVVGSELVVGLGAERAAGRPGACRIMTRMKRIASACAAGLVLAAFAGVRSSLRSRRVVVERPATR